MQFFGFRDPFVKDQCYKLFRESFAASVLAFAEPSDINSLTSCYTSGFLRCSGENFASEPCKRSFAILSLFGLVDLLGL